MRNMNNLKKKPAFTLVEVLIVLVLVGILAGLVMLSSGATIDTSQRAVCAANRRTIKSAYSVESAGSGKNFTENLKNAMEQFAQAAHNNMDVASDEAIYTGICPANGIYLININDDGKLNVFCSIGGHGGDKSGPSGSLTTYQTIFDVLQDIRDIYQIGGLGLMTKIKDKYLNDIYAYGGEALYIKVDCHGYAAMMLYASSKPHTDGGGRLQADYVYDNRTDKWYHCSSTINMGSYSLGDYKVLYGGMSNGSFEKDGKTITFTEVPDFKPF